MFSETPYIINITSDVLINTSVPNNVTLNCSFTGNLVHTTVHWKKGNLDLTHNTIITNNNIAILSLSIDANMKNFMGSYQCVVKNEVGYVSRTTRILPKGNNIILYATRQHADIIVLLLFRLDQSSKKC